jgi:hypothetical protein
MNNSSINRRDFLKGSSLAAAGAVLSTGLAAEGQEQATASLEKAPPDPKNIRNYNPRMHYRRLGKTDLWLSEISLGGHWKNRGGGRF